MTLTKKVDQMQLDLAKIVNLCNQAEDYRMANVAQSALQQTGNLSDQLEQEQSKATAQIEFI